MNLKELTHESHKIVENTAFVKRMISRKLSPTQYYIYLTNLFVSYSELEQYANELGLFKDIEQIQRTVNISKDLSALERDDSSLRMSNPLPSIMNYSAYLRSIQYDEQKLLAHIYVRHMGDLSGGQILKRLVPSKTTYLYEFEGDIAELKSKLRSKLNDDMAEEAKYCFGLIKDFFDELEKHLVAMESTH
jgi:heme oxygenase (biliverdin-producing, ferredoxin)